MKNASILLAAVAAGAVLAPAAQAASTPHARHTHHRTHARPASADADALAAMRHELEAQRAEMASLHQDIATQARTLAETQARLADAQAQLGTVGSEVRAAPAAAKAAASAEVASAIATEHAEARKKDHVDFRGLTIKPGGFLELAGIYRDHFQGNDIASSYAIPFANGHPYYTSENRFSARQSRLSFLAQGKPGKDTTLSMYGEFDFLGGAQTANSNESNSYNPRIRNLYMAIDRNTGSGGWHLLAGQNWSLVTMYAKGLSPRSELTPPQIEAQYIPGFVWARQPQIRLTGDFLDHKLWIAASVENAATTTVGKVPATITYNQAAGSGFDAANSLSLNGTPDLVGKVAFDETLGGHALHVEGFGLLRTFTARLNGVGNENRSGYGFGGGITLGVVPGYLDAQFSGMGGKGIGRYGSAQLSDVTFGSDGSIQPVKEFMLLGGLTAHPTKMLDVYVFAGEEQVSANDQGNGYGLGIATADNSGCFTEGGTCGGASHRIRQLTGGFWQKIYSGDFGRAQIGMQYSYTQRELFAGSGSSGGLPANAAMPQIGQSMGFLSLRYYPF